MIAASLYIGFLLLALGYIGQQVSGLAWLLIVGLAACWGFVCWCCCCIAKKPAPKPEPQEGQIIFVHGGVAQYRISVSRKDNQNGNQTVVI